MKDMLNNKYEYTKIRENIWQIAEDKGVYSTLVKGSKMAVLIDTGYGARNLRAFVEENITTPYMVINSHGHPDHMGGNHWFDTVYAIKEEWDVILHFEEFLRKENGATDFEGVEYELKEIQVGQMISLGDINIKVVPLFGHTKASVGFLVQEEKLLISGDALNESLWLFNRGLLAMANLKTTIKATMELDFDTYLCGHSGMADPKEKLRYHLKNLENLKIDGSTKKEIFGFETYCSKYEDENGKSEIVFTIDKV